MHSSEVGRLASDIASSLGLEWDVDDFEALCSVTNSFKFSLFLAFIEGTNLNYLLSSILN